MADSFALSDLLDKAGKVFYLAGDLGQEFSQEHESERQGQQIGPDARNRHIRAFNEFYAALLELRDEMQHPPDGFGSVKESLLQAAKIAKGIRDTLARDGGFADYLDYFPDLNTVCQSGWEAIKEVSAEQWPNDPFDFVDEPAAPEQSAETGKHNEKNSGEQAEDVSDRPQDKPQLGDDSQPQQVGDSQPERHALYHAADETPPDEYPHGPLTGSKTDLAEWITGKRDHRKTDGLVKRKVCWGRQDSARRVSLWFKDQKRYAEANKRRIEAEQNNDNGH